jgi:hypothetical protein
MSEEKRTVIGDPIWMFDINHRVYRRDKDGRAYGGPIWREHWRKYLIIGENRVSWLVGYDHSSRVIEKCPKKNHNPQKWAFSEQEIDNAAWVHEHRYPIAEAVRGCSDHAVLKQVAALVGWQPEVRG